MGRRAAAGLERGAPELPLATRPRARTLESPAAYPVGTYRVSELGRELKAILGEAYPVVWVAGEIHRQREHRSGHLYFELVEKGRGDQIVGRLDCVAFRTDLARIRRALRNAGEELAEGREVRCRGELDYYEVAGRLQMIVREIDVVFALGRVAQRRQEVVAALREGGLLERNRSLPPPDLPLRIGLVTSEGSAAYHDFVACLAESGFGFEVLLAHTPVQGVGAAAQIARALSALGRERLDCIALVRGGGARSDLAAFDTRVVAEAVARAPVPVLTGLGHEIDRSVADLAAFAALKTPTGVGEDLVRRVTLAERHLGEIGRALRRAAGVPLERARSRVANARDRVPAMARRVARERRRLEELRSRVEVGGRLQLAVARRTGRDVARRLASAAPRALAAGRARPPRLAARITAAARRLLREREVRVAALSRLTAELSPARTLARGFSITRSEGGALVRTPSQVSFGMQVRTETAGGSFVSEVIETGPAQEEKPPR